MSPASEEGMDWSAVRKVDPVFGQTARPEMRFHSRSSGRMVSQIARKSNALWSAFAGTRHRPPEESGRTTQPVCFVPDSNTKRRDPGLENGARTGRSE